MFVAPGAEDAQQRLYFWPDPHGQVEFLPGSTGLRIGAIVQDCASNSICAGCTTGVLRLRRAAESSCACSSSRASSECGRRGGTLGAAAIFRTARAARSLRAGAAAGSWRRSWRTAEAWGARSIARSRQVSACSRRACSASRAKAGTVRRQFRMVFRWTPVWRAAYVWECPSARRARISCWVGVRGVIGAFSPMRILSRICLARG